MLSSGIKPVGMIVITHIGFHSVFNSDARTLGPPWPDLIQQRSMSSSSQAFDKSIHVLMFGLERPWEWRTNGSTRMVPEFALQTGIEEKDH